jgi:hypothetical protein
VECGRGVGSSWDVVLTGESPREDRLVVNSRIRPSTRSSNTMPRQHVPCAMSLPRRARAHCKRARHGLPPIDGTLQGTPLVLVKIASSSVKIDVVSAELQFGTHHGTVLPGPAL